jgi:membrane-bound serine protease (ClpP class)
MDYLTLALILIGIGVLLLAAEVLVPTGGVLVVAALLCFALGVGTILYEGSTTEAVVAVMGLAVGLPAFGYVAVSAWRRMSLDTGLDEEPGPPVPTPESAGLKGRTGRTVSPLRPSGTVEFDGRRVDAMSEGTMLEAGVWVRCVDVRRGQVIVRRMEEPPDEPADGRAAPPDPAPALRLDADPPREEPKRDQPKKPADEFDDFDIGLDRG